MCVKYTITVAALLFILRKNYGMITVYPNNNFLYHGLNKPPKSPV